MSGIRGSCERACYTIDELAQLLGVGKASVYKLLKTGKIPSLKAGKKFVVPRAAVHRVLESLGTSEVTAG